MDRKRLEEIYEVMFERLWGVKMGQIRNMAMEEAEFLWREYRDVMYEMPFQFPADVLFIGRAVGILSGIATSLDPGFDPWAETMPFAKRLAAEELSRDWRGWLDEFMTLAQLMLRMPGRLDRLISHVERGQLALQTGLAPDAARTVRRLERSVDRLTWGVFFTSLLISGTLLRLSEGPSWVSNALFVGAGLSLLWGLTRR